MFVPPNVTAPLNVPVPFDRATTAATKFWSDIAGEKSGTYPIVIGEVIETEPEEMRVDRNNNNGLKYGLTCPTTHVLDDPPIPITTVAVGPRIDDAGTTPRKRLYERKSEKVKMVPIASKLDSMVKRQNKLNSAITASNQADSPQSVSSQTLQKSRSRIERI